MGRPKPALATLSSNRPTQQEWSDVVKRRQLTPGCWVVICDGAKALILENKGDEKFPNLRSIEVHMRNDAKTRELGSDKPPRVQQGPHRSSIDQTDLHDQAEREFLESLAGRLHQGVAAKQPKQLILVAPSRALGMIRPSYTPALKEALIAELDKDFVKMPIPEIEKHVVAALEHKP